MKWPKIGPLNWSVVVNIGGIALGALSAVLVARGVLFRSPLDVLRELEAFGAWDFAVTPGASRLLQGWLSQRLDTQIGCILLAVSFLLQGLAMVAPDKIPRHRSAVFAGLVFMIVASFGYLGITTWSDAHATSQTIDLYESLRARTPKSWQPLITERIRELHSEKPQRSE